MISQRTATRDTWLDRPPSEWLDRWMSALEDMGTTWTETVRTAGERRWWGREERGDRSCGCRAGRDCSCECCVVDADVVVEALAGERRVVPLHVENATHRSVQVVVELSTFSGGAVWVGGQIDGPAEFELGPCERAEVRVVVEVGGEGGREERRGDVERCEVAYADLRWRGCAIRSTRLAVAVLPDRCRRVDIGCGCDCC